MAARALRPPERRPRRPRNQRTVGPEVQQHYQVILQNLRGRGEDRLGPVRTLGISGCAERSGTSTIAGQLAMTAAAGGSRVLLADANLARPAVAEWFAAAPAPGLAEVVRDGARLEESLQPSGFANLSLLAAGYGTPPRILASPGLADILEALRAEFDLVVLDLPARLHRSPALQLAALLDGVLLVVEAGRDSWELARETRFALSRAHVSLIGAVLNKCP
jgi:tyrosine-protein kinase Etk/Wzc